MKLFEIYLNIVLVFISSFVLSYDEIAPKIDPYYGTQGMLIDAGSGGSRLHIFSWEPRVFKTVPPPLTLPRDNEKYTDRISPGISDFVNDFEGLKEYLATLINFAKVSLADKQDFWYTYPFYLRATGGMRLVPYEKRELMMSFIRELFSDKTFCPFYFQFDFARVMSGEEEAVFSWASANYLFGTLLQSIPGSGAVLKPINGTFGTIDLGGASAQISFFVPSQDISEGLFKLQIGSQRHWNVYSKSFLSYGHNSARQRHLQSIANMAYNDGTDSNSISTHCYFSGFEEDFVATIQKTHSVVEETVTIRGPHTSHNHQFDDCYEMIIPLLKKELNVFCNVVYDNQCSMDGFYQPALPTGKIDGHFIASATYKYAWAFLRMPQGGSLTLFKERAREICSLDYTEIKKYHKSLNTTMKKDELLPYYCFITTYVAILLEKGFGFTDQQSIRAIDTVGGHRTGWALGSMLYEINGLPFVLEEDQSPCYYGISAGMISGVLFGAVVMWLINSQSLFFIYPLLKASLNGYTKISDIQKDSNGV